MRDRHEWTEIEDVLLTQLFGTGKSHVEIGKALGMSDSAAGKRCLQLGLRRGRRGANGSARQNGPPSDDDSKIGTRKIEPLTVRSLASQSLHVREWVREVMARR